MKNLPKKFIMVKDCGFGYSFVGTVFIAEKEEKGTIYGTALLKTKNKEDFFLKKDIFEDCCLPLTALAESLYV